MKSAKSLTMYGVFKDDDGKLDGDLTAYIDDDDLDYFHILPGFTVWEVEVRPVRAIERYAP